MRCAGCGSGYHGDATNGRRRIRHAARPACGPSATYRAERYPPERATDREVGVVTTAQLVWILGPRLPEPDGTAYSDE
jgi:hypothetical protein